jgi:hypothetical protein
MLDPQVFALILNTWPVANCTESIASGAVPELVSAKDSIALVVPIA